MNEKSKKAFAEINRKVNAILRDEMKPPKTWTIYNIKLVDNCKIEGEFAIEPFGTALISSRPPPVWGWATIERAGENSIRLSISWSELHGWIDGLSITPVYSVAADGVSAERIVCFNVTATPFGDRDGDSITLGGGRPEGVTKFSDGAVTQK